MTKSAIIGALRVNLGLDSAQFQTGLNNSKKNMDGFARQVKLGMAAVATAVTVTAGAVTAMVTSVANSAGKTADVSDRLGVAVESLQELRHAAEMSGIGAQNFDMALRRMIRRASEAARGTGAAKDAFKELGVSLTDSNRRMRSSEDIFHDVADAMQKIQDPANKLRLAFKIFDTDGAAMVKMFENGSEGIKQFREQAKQLGIVLSEDAVRSASRFNDSLTLISKVAEGFKNRLFAGVIPAFENLAARIFDVASNAQVMDGVINVVSGGMNLLARGIGLVIDNLRHLVDLFKVFVAAKIISYVTAVGGAMIALARTVRVAGIAMALVTSITRVKITTIALLAAAIAKLTGTYDGMVGWLRDAGAAIMESLPEGMRSGIDDLGQSLKSLVGDLDAAEGAAASSFGTYLRVSDEAVDSFGKVGAAAKSAADKIKEMQAEAARIFEQTRTPLEQYQARIAFLNRMREALDEATFSQDTYNRAVLQAQDAFAQAEKAGKKTENVFVSIGQTIAQSFGSAIQGIIDGSRKAIDVVKNLLGQLGNMLINRAFQSLIGFIFPGAGGISLHNLPGNANGTANWRGGITAINERGGEIVDLPKGSRVIPHDVSMAMARGGSGGDKVDITVNVEGANGDQHVMDLVRQGVSKGLAGYEKGRQKRYQAGGQFA